MYNKQATVTCDWFTLGRCLYGQGVKGSKGCDGPASQIRFLSEVSWVAESADKVFSIQEPLDLPGDDESKCSLQLLLSDGPEVTIQPESRALQDALQRPGPLRAHSTPSSHR